MATTKLRTSSQLNVDADFDFQSHKGINLTPGSVAGDAVEFAQLNTAISNAVAGTGSAIHVPVADLAAAKAETDYVDRMIMLIETLGLYRMDVQMIAASNDDTVIRPTNVATDAVAGRWVKMSTSVTDHNLLSGLQGGTTGQYYHLTSSQVALLSGATLSKSDDTNVRLTLGGSYTTALLNAASIAVSWTGTLADARIASASNWNSKQAGHANLTSLAGLTYVSPSFVKMTGANTFALDTTTYLSGTKVDSFNTRTGAVTLLYSDVLPLLLTGFAVGANTAVVATDSIEVAFEKLQGQIIARVVVTAAALTATNDTNVTLSLGGTPATALLQATSLTLGWTGTLADARIASAATWHSKQAGHTNLTSLSALTYVSTSFVKMTAAGTFALDTNTYTNNTGTVTSVSMTVPTGLSVAGSPITTAGTLALTFAAGYSIPTDAVQTNWTTAYTNRITSLTTTGNSGAATLTSNVLNIPNYTLAGLGGQAAHANLTSLSGLTYVALSFVKMSAAGTFSLDTTTYLTGNQSITLSGDISGTGTTTIVTTIGANKVTLGMMAQVVTQTFLGRTTASTGNVEALTVAQAKTMLGVSARTYKSPVTQTPNDVISAFTITTPTQVVAGSEEVFKNGMLMNGGGNDYTPTYGATLLTITFTAPLPSAGDVILVNYSV